MYLQLYEAVTMNEKLKKQGWSQIVFHSCISLVYFSDSSVLKPSQNVVAGKQFKCKQLGV